LKQQQRAGQEVIGVYRDRHPAIVSAWAICQKAWQQIALAEHGHYVQWRDITFERFHDYLRIERPGGFCQYYYGPRIVQGRWPDGGPKQELVYIGRSKGGAMAFRNTYGGDIFQSLCQGTAADLIIHGMGVAEAAGFPPVMSIHDEVVTLIDDGPPRHEELSTLLCQTPEWAEGLPVEAEGWQQRRFTK
jgi:DNA polymerase